MKERPILFSGPMVRAILEGRKTQTRRVISLPTGWDLESPDGQSRALGMITSPHPKQGRFGAFISREDAPGFTVRDIVPCPYGRPGDRLWVREAWKHGTAVYGAEAVACSQYKATPGVPESADAEVKSAEWEGRWRPSIHMPRWASRINLEITGVRVERLRDISEEDAGAEGIEDGGCLNCGESEPCGCSFPTPDATDAFGYLWQQIHGPLSWLENPWVWVIEFKRLEQREGQSQ